MNTFFCALFAAGLVHFEAANAEKRHLDEEYIGIKVDDRVRRTFRPQNPVSLKRVKHATHDNSEDRPLRFPTRGTLDTCWVFGGVGLVFFHSRVVSANNANSEFTVLCALR